MNQSISSCIRLKRPFCLFRDVKKELEEIICTWQDLFFRLFIFPDTNRKVAGSKCFISSNYMLLNYFLNYPTIFPLLNVIYEYCLYKIWLLIIPNCETVKLSLHIFYTLYWLHCLFFWRVNWNNIKNSEKYIFTTY